MQIHARHYRTGKPVAVSLVGNIIESVTDSDRPTADLPFIAPAFFDPQINGHGGIWFSGDQLTPRKVLDALLPQFQFGVARMFPTLITASPESLEAGFLAIRRACEMEPFADELIAGCHLEGPFLSAEDGPRGAHQREFIRPANWDEFAKLQDLSGNRIRLVTLAPEVEGAIEFIQRAVEEGVTIAIGHTAASTDQIAAAVDVGATLSTHLGNGAHPVLPRHPNYIWDQLADSRLAASIIADGFHLPDSVIRSFIAAKGTDRVVLTSDASGLAGCDPGRYSIHGVDVEVEASKRICIADEPGLLAGSGSSILDCVNHLVRSGITELADAIDMAGRTVTGVLGLAPMTLEARQRADLIVFDSTETKPVQLIGTMAAGAIRYSKT